MNRLRRRGVSSSGPWAPGQSGDRNHYGIRTENPCCNPESRAAPERVCGSSSRAGTETDQVPVRAAADCGRADHGRALLVAQTGAGQSARVSCPDGLLLGKRVTENLGRVDRLSPIPKAFSVRVLGTGAHSTA